MEHFVIQKEIVVFSEWIEKVLSDFENFPRETKIDMISDEKIQLHNAKTVTYVVLDLMRV